MFCRSLKRKNSGLNKTCKTTVFINCARRKLIYVHHYYAINNACLIKTQKRLQSEFAYRGAQFEFSCSKLFFHLFDFQSHPDIIRYIICYNIIECQNPSFLQEIIRKPKQSEPGLQITVNPNRHRQKSPVIFFGQRVIFLFTSLKRKKIRILLCTFF